MYCGTQAYLSERITMQTCGILDQDHTMYNNSVPGGKQPLVCYGFLVESGKCQSGCQEPRESICCCCLVAKLCPNLLRIHGLQPTRLLCPTDFPGKNIGVGGHCLHQVLFPTPGRDRTYVSCTAADFFFFFNHQATRQASGLTVWYFTVVEPVDWHSEVFETEISFQNAFAIFKRLYYLIV